MCLSADLALSMIFPFARQHLLFLMAPQLMLTGYQGLDKLHPNAEIPNKASKNHPLDAKEKEYNAALTSFCIRIKKVLAQMKVFLIFSDRYPNKRNCHHLKISIIVSLLKYEK